MRIYMRKETCICKYFDKNGFVIISGRRALERMNWEGKGGQKKALGMRGKRECFLSKRVSLWMEFRELIHYVFRLITACSDAMSGKERCDCVNAACHIGFHHSGTQSWNVNYNPFLPSVSVRYKSFQKVGQKTATRLVGNLLHVTILRKHIVYCFRKTC